MNDDEKDSEDRAARAERGGTEDDAPNAPSS